MEEVAPRTFNYALQLYEAMEAQSSRVSPDVVRSFGYPSSAKEDVLLFKGTIKGTARQIGLMDSTGVKCSSLLQSMNCITVLKRGGGVTNNPSYYLMNYKPTEDDYIKYRENTVQLNRTINPTRSEKLLNDVAHLLENYNLLLGRVAYLEGVVTNHLKDGDGHHIR